jgi:hypothetical protein
VAALRVIFRASSPLRVASGERWLGTGATDPATDAAFNLIATGIVILADFAHQRDRFQRRSDDLLHNILPDEIADRLKGGKVMIADDFAAAIDS